MQSPLHVRTKAVLHMPLPHAEHYLAAFHPELIHALKDVSTKATTGSLAETIELRKAFNTYLTYARSTVWNDTCHLLQRSSDLDENSTEAIVQPARQPKSSGDLDESIS